jgi:hypothetical protein
MLHKFKVGDMVNYRPVDRNLRHLRGVYTIMRTLPGTAGQPEYRGGSPHKPPATRSSYTPSTC